MRNGMPFAAAEAAVFWFAVAAASLGVEDPRVLGIPCRVVWGSVVLRKVLCPSKAWVSATGQICYVCGFKGTNPHAASR
jgi:hypothetical protein